MLSERAHNATLNSAGRDVRRRGSYVLLLRVDRTEPLVVGRLGTFVFAPGRYAYFGSALGGLAARIARHRRSQKRLHWHVDYLLERVTITDVLETEGVERLECALSDRLATEPWTSRPVREFGSSDCGCFSHLHYLSLGAGSVARTRAALRDLVAG